MPRSDISSRRRGLHAFVPALCAALVALPSSASHLRAQTLKGSSASLDRQNHEAQRHDFTYLRTAAQVRTFVELGLLVQLRGNADYELHQVSFPYARPEVLVLVERLASQYRDACKEKLVVTSLTRPLSNQPRNASDRSVHPTGMAVDLRRPNVGSCRTWLENVLLQLEGADVLEATRESTPPHYHIVLFPRQYTSYVSRLAARQADVTVAAAESESDFAQAESEDVIGMSDPTLVELSAYEPSTYRVRAGDSLWTIAQKLGTTVARLRAENDLRSNRIYAGQVIIVPGR